MESQGSFGLRISHDRQCSCPRAARSLITASETAVLIAFVGICPYTTVIAVSFCFTNMLDLVVALLPCKVLVRWGPIVQQHMLVVSIYLHVQIGWLEFNNKSEGGRDIYRIDGGNFANASLIDSQQPAHTIFTIEETLIYKKYRSLSFLIFCFVLFVNHYCLPFPF